jgi:hypothetical protein
MDIMHAFHSLHTSLSKFSIYHTSRRLYVLLVTWAGLWRFWRSASGLHSHSALCLSGSHTSPALPPCCQMWITSEYSLPLPCLWQPICMVSLPFSFSFLPVQKAALGSFGKPCHCTYTFSHDHTCDSLDFSFSFDLSTAHYKKTPLLCTIYQVSCWRLHGVSAARCCTCDRFTAFSRLYPVLPASLYAASTCCVLVCLLVLSLVYSVSSLFS